MELRARVRESGAERGGARSGIPTASPVDQGILGILASVVIALPSLYRRRIDLRQGNPARLCTFSDMDCGWWPRADREGVRMSDVSLYQRIGGHTGVVKLVDDFYRRVLADPQLEPFFAGVGLVKLRHMQEEFFSAALGGPVAYTGRPIEHAHQGLKITLADYQRFVQHLFATLVESKMNEDERYEVVSRLNLYTHDVVSAGTGTVG